MSSFTKREQIVILIIVVLMVFITILKFDKKDDVISLSEEKTVDETDEKEYEIEDDITKDQEESIMIHISGEVYKPGVYEMQKGDRVKDAVDKADGLKKDADIDKINLAKKLEDEEKIYIPAIGEEIENYSEDQTNGEKNDKIDINNADKEELMTLNGIGEVLADRIIEYRENNKFKTIEDLKNVSGIGDKKFENVKEYIIVK